MTLLPIKAAVHTCIYPYIYTAEKKTTSIQRSDLNTD